MDMDGDGSARYVWIGDGGMCFGCKRGIDDGCGRFGGSGRRWRWKAVGLDNRESSVEDNSALSICFDYDVFLQTY